MSSHGRSGGALIRPQHRNLISNKNKVEGLVSYARRNFLVPIPVFESFAALNAHLLECCRRRMTACCWSQCTRMNITFADVLYVVSATEGDRLEFWAASTSRRTAASQVQRLLPPGWTATLTSWRLSPERAAALKMPPNTVRRLT